MSTNPHITERITNWCKANPTHADFALVSRLHAEMKELDAEDSKLCEVQKASEVFCCHHTCTCQICRPRSKKDREQRAAYHRRVLAARKRSEILIAKAACKGGAS